MDSIIDGLGNNNIQKSIVAFGYSVSASGLVVDFLSITEPFNQTGSNQTGNDILASFFIGFQDVFVMHDMQQSADMFTIKPVGFHDFSDIDVRQVVKSSHELNLLPFVNVVVVSGPHLLI
jgi:hypothetical protein